ncbi:MAG: DUF2341 domain-containing protein [Ferruginibacter sp.]
MKNFTFLKLQAVLIGVLLLLSLLPDTAYGQSWYNSSWLYRKAITIDYTKVGAGPHTNFPVLISITDANLQTGAQADFDDILFTSSNGTTKLDHEVESYTSGTGALVAWVEVSSLSSSVNTVIYMYYGNAAASAQQNITGTWDATFKGVYHLNNAFTDATSNAFNGTNTGTTNLTGKISNGRGFVRSDGSDFIQITGLMGSPTSFTLSAWATLTTTDPNGAEIISMGDNGVLRYDEAGANKTSGIAYNGASVWTTTASGINYAGTGWHYVSYTFDDGGNSQKVYVDGVQVATGSSAASPVYTSGGTNTFIGKHGNANVNMDFDGTIDEARVAGANRSAGWVLTEYNNQNSPATFYSVGSQEYIKVFTGTGNFSDATKWTGGTLPVAGENLIIDGACTVDNSGTTDNVAYGTLTIGTATGRTLNWITSGTNRLNVSNVSAGAGASTLSMTNGGTLIIRGTFAAASLTFTPGTGTIEVQSTMTLPAAYATYNNLTVNSSATVTTAVNTTVNGSLNVAATLQLGTLNMTAGDLQGAGTIISSGGTPALTIGSLNTSTTFSGVIGTGAIALTKNGTGTLTLSGTNTFTGITTVSAGTLKLNNTAALGTTAGATSVSNGAVLDLNGINYSNAEALSLAGTGISSGGVLINSNAATATYAGNITLSSTNAPQITATNAIVLSGVISGAFIASANGLTITGSAGVTFSGNNTYTGWTTINSGAVLRVGSNNALGAATASSTNNSTVINSGGVLDLYGTTYTTNEYVQMNGTGISGGGAVINSSSTTANFACQFDTWAAAIITADNPIILSGMVQWSGGNLTVAGASFLTLGINSGNKTSALIINSGVTLKFGANDVLNTSGGNITINSGGALDLNGFSLSRAISSLNGTGISGGGGITNSSATAATCSGAITLGSAASIAGVAGLITVSGNITGAGFGLTLAGAAGGSVTNIIAGASTTITKTGAGTWILSALNTYTGATTVTGGILRATNNTVVASTNGPFGNNASGLNLNGGTIQSDVATFSRPITVSATGSGLDAYGSARTISSAINNATVSTSYNLNIGGTTNGVLEGQNLTLSGVITNTPGALSLTKIGTNTVSFINQAVTIQNLDINAGTFTSTSATMSLAGSFSNFGTFTHNSGNVTFNGSALQGIGGATFNNLTINNAAGVTLWWNVTYSGILTLSSGIVATNTYTLKGSSTASVSRTSGHVFGKFQKNIATGATSKTFEIGDATNYTPVTVAFASVTTAGDLIAGAASGDHANIGTSTINPSYTANRNWTLTNSGVLFTTCDVTFTFVAGDLDAGATPGNFIVGRYNAGWTYPTVGTKTSTTTQATGLTAFDDFQLGESAKIFTGTGNFSTAARWTGGTLPVAGENLIIDGACTVDNNVGTDNVAYGSLTIGSGTARTLNWAASGTNRLNVTNVSAGTVTGSLLDMTNGGTLVIRGTWTSTNLTFTPGTGTIDIRSTMMLPGAYATYYNLIINAPSATVTSGVSTGVTNFTMTSGTLDLNTFTLTTTGIATYTSGTINNGTATATGATTTFAGTVFGAVVNATSDALNLNGSTFNNTATLTKNGTTNITSTGGNTFNATATIATSSTGYFILGNSSPDIFNGSTTFTNTGTNTLYVAYNASGNQFNGNVTFNNTGTGSNIKSSFGSSATAVYSGNIVVNNTSAGGVYFGASGGTTSLANTKTITKGGTGFTTGTLLLRDFTQLGSTAQALTLTGTALLQIGPSAIFNGNVDFTSPQVLLNGATYNGTASFTKNGTTNNLGNGGNTFNGATALANSSNAYFATGFTTADIFNADLTITNTGTGFTALADEATGTMFNGNIIVNSTNGTGTAGVTFGNGPGTAVTSTLATGKTISVGGTGFTAGRLLIRRMTQSGATAQSFTLTGTSIAYIGPYSIFNGGVNFVSPQLFLNGCQFNSTSILTKNGATDNISTGNNIFNGATTITSSGAGYLRMAATTADDFNSDATFIQTSSGLLQPAYSTNNTFAGNVSTAGTATAISYGTGNGTVTLNGTIAQAIAGSLSPTFYNLVISNTGNTVTPVVNSIITNNLSVTSGTFDLGTYTADRLTAGGTLTISNGALLKVGGTNTIPSNYSTHSIGATSTVEYNGTNQSLAVLNSSQNYGHLTIAGSGTKTMAGNSSVAGTLTFTAGTITTGAYTLYLNSTGTVSRTSGHVIGNFKKYIATGATSKTFEIGDATNYTPVSVAFASVTTAGDLTAQVTATDHPSLASSGIRTDKSVNRYWNLTQSGIVFTTATATFNWVAGDLDAGTTTANFKVGNYNNPTWTPPAVASPSATSIQATGLTTFGDFAVGENCAVISQIPSTNLIANYKFTGNANDATGNNNGTLQNAPSLTADRFGIAANAYTFNGSSQYVSTTNSYVNPGNYSISIWFKTSTTTGGKLIGFGNAQTGQSTSYDRHIYMNNAGQIYFGVYTGSVVTLNSSLSYNDNTWHLATATQSSTVGMALYIDGALVGSNTGILTAQNYTGYWRIGYDNVTGWTSTPSSFYFNGALDDALIYHRALTSAEVTTLYNSPDGAGNNGPVCMGASISLSATTVGGATYAWTGPNSYTSSSQNPAFTYSSSAAGTYTLLVTSTGCSATAYTNISSSTTTGQWTGNTNTAWATAGNWCNGVVPASNANISIPVGLSVYPVITTTIAVNNITIPSGASLTVTGGTLQIAGTISAPGTFNVTAGTIEMNGASAQTIPANAFTNNSILNLVINNNVTLAGTAAITGTLTVGTSGKTFATGGFVTLKSTALGTAKIAAMPVDGAGAATSYITGIVTVERYIPQNRSWRLITSPLSNTGFIYNSWQNAGVYQAGKGMFVTGPAPTGANGLDASTQNSVSIKTFSTATQAYVNITNTKSSNLSNSTGTADNIGYFAFIRGDRDPNNLFAPNTNITTLSSAGTVQTGKQIFTASSTLNAYTLVGNPYASPVDFNNVERAHIRKRFYAWDATIGLGVYVVLDDLDGNSVFSTSNGGSLQDKNIQSGQAFFVETDTAGAAAINFYESSKSTVSTNAGFRPLDNTKSLAMTLNFLQADNSVNKADAALAEFDGSFNSGVDFQDAIKFTNIGETFSLQRNGTALAIERRPLINMDDTLFLKLIQASQRNYQFVFTASNMEQPGLLAFLEDNYTGTATPVNLQGSTSINFTIDAAAASIKSNRFRIVFNTPIVLPVNFSHVKAWQHGDDIAVRWKVENQLNVQRYEVEKSTDGSNFTKVNSQPVTNNSASVTYNWLDTDAVAGDNFFRIRNVDVNGTVAYSTVVKVTMGKGLGSISVYPNPVTGNVMNLQLKNIAAGQYSMRLLNPIGQVLLVNNFLHTGGNAAKKIMLSNQIVKGLYTLEITAPDKTTTAISVLNE